MTVPIDVGDADADVDVDAEAVFEAISGNLQVEFALPAEDDLAQVLVVGDGERGIFPHELAQALRQFVLLTLAGRHHRRAVARFGERDGLDHDVASFEVEGVIGGGMAQLDEGAEVAGLHPGHRLAVAPVDDVELSQAFGGTDLCILQVEALLQRTRIDAEERIVADVLLGHGAVDEGNGLAGRVGGYAAAVGGRGRRHLGRRRAYVVDETHQTGDADVPGGAGQKDGEEAAPEHGLVQPLAHLVLGQLAFLEVQFHQAFVVFGNAFDKFIVQGIGLLPKCRVDLMQRRLALFIEGDLLHQQHVDDGAAAFPAR